MTAVEQEAGWQERYRGLQSTLLEQYRAIPDGSPDPAREADVQPVPPAGRRGDARPRRGGLRRRARTSIPVARTAEVLGMTTYEHLVDATLPYGLMPLCVPQLRTITLGGAVTGLGIESASFRNGLPHESVLEMDILTGAGEILTVSGRPTTPTATSSTASPTPTARSATHSACTIELEPAKPYVAAAPRALRRPPMRSRRAMTAIARVPRVRGPAGRLPRRHGLLAGRAVPHASGRWSIDCRTRCRSATTPGWASTTARSRRKPLDGLTIHDYLWRWDTDWFWCSRAFGAQNPAVRRLWPSRRLRSDVYWKLVALDRRYDLSTGSARRRGRPAARPSSRTSRCPSTGSAEFLEFFHREVGIEPIWLCPLRQRDPAARWPLVPVRSRRALRQRRLLVDRPAARRRRARRGPHQPPHRGRS